MFRARALAEVRRAEVGLSFADFAVQGAVALQREGAGQSNGVLGSRSAWNVPPDMSTTRFCAGQVRPAPRARAGGGAAELDLATGPRQWGRSAIASSSYALDRVTPEGGSLDRLALWSE